MSTAVAVVLIVIAYAYPVWQHLQMQRSGSPRRRSLSCGVQRCRNASAVQQSSRPPAWASRLLPVAD